MTPFKAFAWTSAYVLAGSFIFWSRFSDFVEAAYRHWFADLLYLCLFVPLSWFVYRSYHRGSYRRGSNDSFFANIPKREQRAMKIVGGVLQICLAVLEIVLASSEADHRLFHFAVASFCLVLGADNWRRYLELKGPEISSSH